MSHYRITPEMMAERAKFEIYQSDKDTKFYWRLWYLDNQIIATGHQGFDTPAQCEGQIHLVIAGAIPITEIIHNYPSDQSS